MSVKQLEHKHLPTMLYSDIDNDQKVVFYFVLLWFFVCFLFCFVVGFQNYLFIYLFIYLFNKNFCIPLPELRLVLTYGQLLEILIPYYRFLIMFL